MITSQSIPRNKLPFFSKDELDFIYNQEKLNEFIGLPFAIENFEKQIKTKKKLFTDKQRQTLTKVLEGNYATLPENELACAQIELLKEDKTYTVTTGHQLCLYGGPLYFFIKIIHTIRLSEALKKQYPEYNFIPVFWMASEDHDSEEIQSLNLFGKTITWNHEQNGAVGRFDLRNLSAVKKQLLEVFRKDEDSSLFNYLDKLSGANYAEACMQWIHSCFGRYGLLVIDGDQRALKEPLVPVFRKELTTHFSKKCIEKSNEALLAKGRKTQIHSRDINLFYMVQGSRTRILKEGAQFKINEQIFTSDEILQLLEKHPERFSPNVVLRPLFQESILPNLCYIGGMAEMKYWAQLKNIFTSCKVPFPILQMRSNCLWIDPAAHKIMTKLEIEPLMLFDTTESLQKNAVQKADPNPIDKNRIEDALKSIQETYEDAIQNDPSLRGWLGAELKKLSNSQGFIQGKIDKSKKTIHESSLQKIANLKSRLFPNQKFQERVVNILHFCNQHDVEIRIQELYKAIEPLNTDLVVLIEQ